jgi:hypothetical protein
MGEEKNDEAKLAERRSVFFGENRARRKNQNEDVALLFSVAVPW